MVTGSALSLGMGSPKTHSGLESGGRKRSLPDAPSTTTQAARTTELWGADCRPGGGRGACMLLWPPLPRPLRSERSGHRRSAGPGSLEGGSRFPCGPVSASSHPVERRRAAADSDPRVRGACLRDVRLAAVASRLARCREGPLAGAATPGRAPGRDAGRRLRKADSAAGSRGPIVWRRAARPPQGRVLSARQGRGVRERCGAGGWAAWCVAAAIVRVPARRVPLRVPPTARGDGGCEEQG